MLRPQASLEFRGKYNNVCGPADDQHWRTIGTITDDEPVHREARAPALCESSGRAGLRVAARLATGRVSACGGVHGRAGKSAGPPASARAACSEPASPEGYGRRVCACGRACERIGRVCLQYPPSYEILTMIGRAPPRTAGFALRQQWETVDLCRMPSRSNDFHAAEAAKAAEAAAAAAAAAKSAGGRRRDDVAVEAKTEAATHSRAPRRIAERLIPPLLVSRSCGCRC
jgi:hypothetical protein